ncbi:MAG: isoprenylcysteine carboxylmethyltransferase family protein [Rhodospirillaceae bacterium]
MDHVWYGLAWLSFGLGHSVLAARSVKDRLDGLLGRRYRLAYNGWATLHLLAVWLSGRFLYADAPPPGLPGWWGTVGAGLLVAGIAVMVLALREYDRGRLLGLAQIRAPDLPEDETLRVEGLHRYVRHPLYGGLFLALWGQAQTEFGLATAAWASLYLLIGTAFEERRLAALYGEDYLAYRRRVPAFVPWRGRC